MEMNPCKVNVDFMYVLYDVVVTMFAFTFYVGTTVALVH